MLASNCGMSGCHDVITHEEGVITTLCHNKRDGLLFFMKGVSKVYERV